MENQSFQTLIRARMRQIREEHGKTGDDVAQVGRALGAPWDFTTISGIETGKRRLTIDELLFLPTVLSIACDDTILLSDLLPYEPGPETRELADALITLAEPWFKAGDPAHWPGVRDGVRELIDIEKEVVAERRAASLPIEEYRQLADKYGVPSGELMTTPLAEYQVLADEYGVSSDEVWDAVHGLVESGTWVHHSLRAERERRLDESGEDLTDARRVRALRAWATKRMKQELRDELGKADDGDDQEAAGRQARGEVADAGRR
jgi:transcriptional regulator with XRE-family HTH domain